MEASGINNDVEIVLFRAFCLDPGRGDSGDGGRAQIDDVDVVAVEGFVIIFFAGRAFGPERMIFGDQLLRFYGIFYPRADLLRKKIGDIVCEFATSEQIMEVT